MRRRWILTILFVILATCVALAYRFSPLSRRTTTLRVQLAVDTPYGDTPNAKRFRAVLANDGYLPVVILECETVSDAMEAKTEVVDGIERWDPNRGAWATVLDRRACEVFPTGRIEARFSSRLLWPWQRLYTAPFFPDASVFRSGDNLRFVVFPRGEESNSKPISSPPFVVP